MDIYVKGSNEASNESKVIGKHGWTDMMKSFAQVFGIKTSSKKHMYVLFV